MNICMISENDPAGMGIAFTRAINRHTSHKCRLITTKTRYNFNFKKDLHIPDLDEEQCGEVRQVLKQADILHFHILADEDTKLGDIRIRDYIKGKGVIHHHHGHPHFRSHPEVYRKKYERLKRQILVSTPDLLKLLPEAQWQPNLVPIEDPLYRPAAAQGNGGCLIGQSVTRKELKNTQELLKAVAGVKSKTGLSECSLDIIENTDWRECLQRKRRCQIIFDHMQGYYGVSSLESLSQGKPVLAGLDSWNISWIQKFTGRENLPWIIARNEKELEKEILYLVNDADRRMAIGRESRRFMTTAWTEQHVLQNLFDVYAAL